MSTKKAQKSQNLLSKLRKLTSSNTDLQILLFLVAEVIIILLYKYDTEYSYNIFIVYLWLFNIIAGLYFSITRLPEHFKSLLAKTFYSEWKWILGVTIFSLVTRLILLDIYPYVALGDELREIGLNGYNFITGNNKDYFQLGSYAGYTYIFSIPGVIARFFFDGSPLTFRVPAALAGSLAVGFSYLLGYIWKKRQGGTILSLLLASSTIHLHESRTEFIIASSSLIAIIVFLSSYLASRYKKAFFLLGIAFGFSMHAYVAVRSIMLITALILAFKEIITLYSSTSRKKTFNQSLLKIYRFISGFILGFGPSMIIPNFLGSSGSGSLIFNDPLFKNTSIQNQLEMIAQLYEKSLGVYFYEGTTANFHFPGSGSLLDFPLTIFFILGIASLILLKKKSYFDKTVIAILLIAPFFNQVLVGEPGEEHRILTLLPFAILAAVIGIVRFCQVYSKKKNYLLTIIITFSIFFSIFNYFFLRLSDKTLVNVNFTEYKFEYMARYISEDNNPEVTYVIYTDSAFSVNQLHYFEKLRFMADELDVLILDEAGIELTFPEGFNENTQVLLYTDIPLYKDDIDMEISFSCPDSGLMPEYKCPPNHTESSFGVFIASY